MLSQIMLALTEIFFISITEKKNSLNEWFRSLDNQNNRISLQRHLLVKSLTVIGIYFCYNNIFETITIYL